MTSVLVSASRAVDERKPTVVKAMMMLAMIALGKKSRISAVALWKAGWAGLGGLFSELKVAKPISDEVLRVEEFHSGV
jgi:hypothetical protein